jgi:hypothetical protein
MASNEDKKMAESGKCLISKSRSPSSGVGGVCVL